MKRRKERRVGRYLGCAGCGRQQNYARSAEPGGITWKEAQRIGWTGTLAKPVCPFCSGPPLTPPKQIWLVLDTRGLEMTYALSQPMFTKREADRWRGLRSRDVGGPDPRERTIGPYVLVDPPPVTSRSRKKKT